MYCITGGKTYQHEAKSLRSDYNAFKRGYVYSYAPKESNNFSCELMNQITTSVYLLRKEKTVLQKQRSLFSFAPFSLILTGLFLRSLANLSSWYTGILLFCFVLPERTLFISNQHGGLFLIYYLDSNILFPFLVMDSLL